MINLKYGNLLEAETEALVNAVNCFGVMGKGIALQFKLAFTDNFIHYEMACRAKQVQPGKMFVVPTGELVNPKYIINFPTKNHWKEKSKLEDIEKGLADLVKVIQDLGITSIAVPALGCGLGGLDWAVVKPLIEHAFLDLPEVDVWLYPPSNLF